MTFALLETATCRAVVRGPFPRRAAAVAARAFSSEAPPAAAAGTTHFGFQQVREEEKKPMVASVFHKVAERCVSHGA